MTAVPEAAGAPAGAPTLTAPQAAAAARILYALEQPGGVAVLCGPAGAENPPCSVTWPTAPPLPRCGSAGRCQAGWPADVPLPGGVGRKPSPTSCSATTPTAARLPISSRSSTRGAERHPRDWHRARRRGAAPVARGGGQSAVAGRAAAGWCPPSRSRNHGPSSPRLTGLVEPGPARRVVRARSTRSRRGCRARREARRHGRPRGGRDATGPLVAADGRGDPPPAVPGGRLTASPVASAPVARP